MHKHVRSVLQATPGVGRAGFPALLMDQGFINRSDLVVAQQHADRERIELADAFVALGLVEEGICYAALAEAAGLDLVNAVEMATSELAVRLVPERLARRHVVVPLRVDNRTLTYATCRPFDPEIERDLSFASGPPHAADRGGALGRARGPRPLLPQAARARRPRRAAERRAAARGGPRTSARISRRRRRRSSTCATTSSAGPSKSARATCTSSAAARARRSATGSAACSSRCSRCRPTSRSRFATGSRSWRAPTSRCATGRRTARSGSR